MWGTTVSSGRRGAGRRTGRRRQRSLELTGAVERCLLADLPEALDRLLEALAERAALDADVVHLMEALPALARAQRYGDVRGTDTSRPAPGGRGAGAADLRRAAAGGRRPRRRRGGRDCARHGSTRVHCGRSGCSPDGGRGRTTAARALAGRPGRPGRPHRPQRRCWPAGWSGCCVDAERLDDAPCAAAAGAVARASRRSAKAAWVDGFFADGALLLIHDAELRGLLDGWVAGLDEREFVDVLPLVRRTFGTFSAGRAALASPSRVRPRRRPAAAAATADDVDAEPRRPRAGHRRADPAGGPVTEAGRRRPDERRGGAPRWRLLLGEAGRGARSSAALSRGRAGDGRARWPRSTTPGEADGARRRRRAGGLGASAPRVARWLGDIRTYFPTSVVQVMQRDAIERLDLTSMLLEPELLDSVQPDVHLAGTLVSLNKVMPETHPARRPGWWWARWSPRSSGGSPSRPGRR